MILNMKPSAMLAWLISSFFQLHSLGKILSTTEFAEQLDPENIQLLNEENLEEFALPKNQTNQTDYVPMIINMQVVDEDELNLRIAGLGVYIPTKGTLQAILTANPGLTAGAVIIAVLIMVSITGAVGCIIRSRRRQPTCELEMSATRGPTGSGESRL